MLDALTGTLEGGLPVLSRTVGAWVAESEIAEMLRETEHAHVRLPPDTQGVQRVRLYRYG